MNIFTVSSYINGEQYHVVGDSQEEPDYFHNAEIDIRRNFWDIKPGDVVFDIGAERGTFTVDALLKGAKHVYSIEPNRKNFYYLSLNVILNGFTDCTPLNVALADKFGTAHLHRLGKRAASLNVTQTESDRGEPVITVKLDHLVNTYRISQLDWIKLDVDGVEMQALEGMKETLAKFSPKVLIEEHINFFPDIDKQVKGFMEKLGYKEEILFEKEKYGKNCLYTKI